LGCCRGHDNRVLKGAVVLERLDDARHRRALLADADIDAVELLALVARGVDLLLVQDGVDDHRGLAGLAVADDQLTLAAPYGDERVDGLKAGLHRLVHRLARDDTGSLHLDAGTLGSVDRPLAVDWLTKRIDHAAKQLLADRHFDDGARTFDEIA